MLAGLLNRWTRAHNKNVEKIFFDEGAWMHRTRDGYFAYPAPVARLDMALNEQRARWHFFWGYQPKEGDVVLDIGAGVGEETLLFSKAVGASGRVICVEAHPRAHRCLQKMAAYNQLTNVVTLHHAVAEPSCTAINIKDEEYLTNRVGDGAGIRVPAATVDAIREKFNLERIHFLKMNIEGAERLALRGMAETLRHTETLCVACHDFLADERGVEFFRTKAIVREFLQQSGLKVVERAEANAPAYISDHVWAFNTALLESAGRAAMAMNGARAT